MKNIKENEWVTLHSDHLTLASHKDSTLPIAVMKSSCVMFFSVLCVVAKEGKWFTLKQKTVNHQDVIAVLNDRSLTSCQLACQSNNRCVSVGMVNTMKNGKCFLIGKTAMFSSQFLSDEKSPILFVTQMVSSTLGIVILIFRLGAIHQRTPVKIGIFRLPFPVYPVLSERLKPLPFWTSGKDLENCRNDLCTA